MSPAHRVVEALTRDHSTSSRYAWIIDTDHLFEPSDPIGDNEAGVAGPSNAPAALLARLTAGDGVQFTMYDDDGELYYTGRIIALEEDGTDQTFETCGEEFFGPLWDFGTPGAGAVEIRFMHHGHWTTL